VLLGKKNVGLHAALGDIVEVEPEHRGEPP